MRVAGATLPSPCRIAARSGYGNSASARSAPNSTADGRPGRPAAASLPPSGAPPRGGGAPPRGGPPAPPSPRPPLGGRLGAGPCALGRSPPSGNGRGPGGSASPGGAQPCSSPGTPISAPIISRSPGSHGRQLVGVRGSG